MKRYSYFFLLLAVLLTTQTLTQHAVAQEDTRILDDLSVRVDQAIDDAIAERRIVGAVVVIARDGELIYRRAAGFADREAERPLEEDAIFRVASMTKPLVSTAALALVEQGVLDLEAPVTRWLPDFRPALPDGTTPRITIQQLLTHTAGLSYGFLQPSDGSYHRAGVSDGLDQPGMSFEEELNRITEAGLAYAPGTAWGYSVAIDVLGSVIEEATGKPLPEVVSELVTSPLGMTDTGFSVTDSTRLAVPYADGENGEAPVRMSDPYTLPYFDLAGIRFAPSRTFDERSFPSGGAGMVGTAADFLAFFEAIRTGGGDVVGPENAQAMMTNQTADLEVISGPGWGFGYGGAVLIDPDLAHSPQSPGTWSWGGAYGQSWFVDPAQRLTIVALTNTAIEGMSGQFPTDLVQAVYESSR